MNYTTNKRRKPYWLRRLSINDRRVVDAVAKWLRPIKWQWYITLTFPWDVRPVTAYSKLRQFANRLEKFTHANVCYVAGQESRSHPLGMNVPPHFHLLLTSHARISREAIEAIWFGLIKSGCDEYVKMQDCVLAKPFESNKLGMEYCLKGMNEDLGEWFMHRLEHFLPNVPGPSKPNHHTVRSARRANTRPTRFWSRGFDSNDQGEGQG
jgi:hypothetical protein